MIKTFGDGRVAADAKVFEWGRQEVKTGVSFGLICNKFYGDEDPTYIQCTIWNADEKIAQHITTGKQIIFEGKLTRNKEGYYSVSIDDWNFGASPRRDEQSNGRQENPGNGGGRNYGNDGDLAFNQ